MDDQPSHATVCQQHHCWRSARRCSEAHNEEDDTYEIGDIVGMVSKGSTLHEPKVLIGKVIRTDRRKGEALLAYLQPIPHTRNRYRLKVGEET